ncbi:hypothetical protein C8R48DRAFT_767066 [Suillus tomentosus]|nr:hypothetical protein C8R48DRAFT_767066 [Suillus tomentosus]
MKIPCFLPSAGPSVTTEYTEHLHIDFTKDAYRATNHKDEFAQMTRWLKRKEKIVRHDKFIQWQLNINPFTHHPHPPDLSFRRTQTLTKHPSAKAVPIQRLISDYGAIYFREALARYIAQQNHLNETLSRRHLENLAANVVLPFRSVAVHHKINVHAKPGRAGSSQQDDAVPTRFDTVLVNDGTGDSVGVKGYRVGQIRTIFSIQQRDALSLFPPTSQPPKHLAYIEWFTPFSSMLDSHHGHIQGARAAFDVASVYTDQDPETIYFLLLIKAISLFDANQHDEANLLLDELAAGCPNTDTHACHIVQAYLCVQLGIKALNGGCYDEAAEHFTIAINSGALSSKSNIHLIYEDLVVLFGWDLKSLWLTAHRKRCDALHRTDRLQDAVKSYQAMMVWSDEYKEADFLGWSNAFRKECSALCLTNGDAALATNDYDTAIELYSVAVNLDSATDVVFENRSKVKLGKMLWMDALLDAQKVIQLNPSSHIGYKLSMQWEGKELLLQDIQGKVVYKLDPVGGIKKLQSFCETARDLGYHWAWSDTCCIDKTNNVELQESVNSMFIWYHHSALTVVYLSDVPPSSKPGALARSA